jgi:stage II sporulation protein D
MSQWGARGFAEHGWGCRRILAHYYPGTTLHRESGITVRVLVAEVRRAVTIGSAHPFRATDGSGRTRVLPAGRRRIVHGPFPLRFDGGAAVLSLDGAGYRGALVVRGRPGSLQVVNELPLERYLRGVVPWEMPHRWPAEALRAQAVAARSYALATLKHGAAFDLYADTRDQVYGGIRAETRETNLAVGATAGQVLTWDDRPALTYYFSTSGGRTAAAGDSLPWAPRVPYLVSVEDPYDGASPHHTWGPIAFGAKKLASLLQLPGLRRLELVRAASGRVRTVRVRWRGGTAALAGRMFQRELGLPSAWFALGRRPGVPIEPRTPRLRGWIVVVASVPVSERRPRGRVLRSDDYPGLAAGYWVVFRGPFHTRAQALAAVTGGAYVRPLTPG